MPPAKGEPNFVGGPGDYLTDPVYNDTYPAIDPTKASLAGKSVFITGASKGIGRAIALSFAKAGSSDIAIGARSNMDTLEQEMGKAAEAAGKRSPRVLQVKLDVTSRESVEAAAVAVQQSFGKLDILINNAGVCENLVPVADSDPDDWWNTWTVNLRGPYLIARAFLPLLLKGGDKQMVSVSSAGAHLHTPGLSSYQSCKLALLRFTEFLCVEYGQQGLMAFSVHPGSVPTGMTTGPDGEVPEHLKKIFVETPELSGDTIVFLTKEKRDWLAGRYISCTWDMPQLMAMEEDIVSNDKLKVRLVI
ncbi:hypothetical protein G7Y79_00029g064030 [Physcia stellaris]|nr:hypothetical protein G7Y79_00029g064030 [Physcia stellaris]